MPISDLCDLPLPPEDAQELTRMAETYDTNLQALILNFEPDGSVEWQIVGKKQALSA